MTMEYIRKTYGVPAKRGGRVVYSGVDGKHKFNGTITGSHKAYLRIRFDGSDYSQMHHPTYNIEYLP